MASPRQRPDSEDGFVLRGGVLALDLVNTAIAVRGKAQDLLVTPQDVARWWAVIRRRYPDLAARQTLETPTAELLDGLRRLRGAVRQVCSAVTRAHPCAAADVATINQALRTAQVALAADEGTRFRQTYLLAADGSELLFQVALSTMELLTGHDLARLHTCRHERCVVYFYDTTKSGTRQWCSPECLNRARSSANYRRRKAASAVASEERPAAAAPQPAGS